MVARDRVLSGARVLLRVILAINWISAVGFGGLLLLSVPFHGLFEARIVAKYADAVDAAQVVMAMRGLFVLALAAVAVAWVICTRLLAMIATVAAGDPFVADNARRLTAIGWAMVGWQLLDLVMGAMTAWLSRLGVDHAGWTPSIAGWIVVMMVFVLGRVFAHGAAMRDELEATV